MKKLLLVLVLGGALLFPIVGLADTEGEAEVQLKLTAVINVNVLDTLTDLELLQADLDALAVYDGTGGDIFGTFGGDFTVQIVALTNFKVEMSYTCTINTVLGNDFTDEDAVLMLLDDVGDDIAYIPYATDVLPILGFLNANNTPGEEQVYGLKVNLDNLGDRQAGDVIVFTVMVTVTDVLV